MIKYKLDIVNALKDRGVNPGYIRENKIFSESTMTKFRKKDTHITVDNIDIVCKLLNCQPGDIIEYIPDQD